MNLKGNSYVQSLECYNILTVMAAVNALTTSTAVAKILPKNLIRAPIRKRIIAVNIAKDFYHLGTSSAGC